MNVTVIGGGDAFSNDNSSFLIETSPLTLEPASTIKILFDCSERTFQYYKNNIADIDYVFISHTHFGHIGGLEQLIFYRYYLQGGKITKIFASEEVKKELEVILKDCNKSYANNKVINRKLFEIVTEINIPTYDIELIKGNHIVKANYGFLIKDKPETLNFGDKKALFISGDTKATEEIKDKLNNVFSDGFSLTVFHDYSDWDDEENNIHCCRADAKRVYNGLFNNPRIRWFRYHNEAFNTLYKDTIVKL